MHSFPTRRRSRRLVAALLALGLGGAALAQEQPATAPAPLPVDVSPIDPVAAPVESSAALPANTVVELEMVDSVSSKASRPGDFFKMRVAIDVRVGDDVLIPAGTPAVGQVVHAAKAGGGGKAGELILAARYLELPQGKVRLRSGFGAASKDRTGAALATSMFVGVFGMLVKGKELELPAGSALSARLAEALPAAEPQ